MKIKYTLGGIQNEGRNKKRTIEKYIISITLCALFNNAVLLHLIVCGVPFFILFFLFFSLVVDCKRMNDLLILQTKTHPSLLVLQDNQNTLYHWILTYSYNKIKYTKISHTISLLWCNKIGAYRSNKFQKVLTTRIKKNSFCFFFLSLSLILDKKVNLRKFGSSFSLIFWVALGLLKKPQSERKKKISPKDDSVRSLRNSFFS